MGSLFKVARHLDTMERIVKCSSCKKELNILQVHYLPGQDLFSASSGLSYNTGENYCEDCYKQLTIPSKKVPLSREESLVSDDHLLFNKLRRVRMQLSRKETLPAYHIFNDKTLIQLSEDRPRTREQLRKISGIGPEKLGKYGDYILQAINEFLNSKKNL